MNSKVQEEIKIRVQILKELGLDKSYTDRILKDDDFVLAGYTINPAPEYIECKRIKKEFEDKYGVIVLMGLLNVVTDGDYEVQCMSLIYLSKEEEDWEFERSELKQGCAIAGVYNFTEDMFEVGGIQFEITEAGYPIRTA